VPRWIVPFVAVAVAYLALACTGGGGAGEEFNAGAADQYALTSITTYTDGDVAERSTEPGSEGEFVLDGSLVFHLVRLESGDFIALSARDPGSDCWVPWQPDFEFRGRTGWFVDPCGGSTYDERGTRVSGPATRDLDRHPVEVREGNVYVNLAGDALIPGEAFVESVRPETTATATAEPPTQTATPTATVTVEGATPTPASTATPTPTPTPTPTSTPTAAATPPPTPTGTPRPEATPTATPTPGATPPATTSGSPFSGDDFLAALAADGIDYEPRGVGAGCAGARVRPVEYGPAGGGTEPIVTLWVYPSPAMLQTDWELPSSGAPRSKLEDCPLAGTFVFWNANLLIDFGAREVWGAHTELREAIREAFLGMGQ